LTFDVFFFNAIWPFLCRGLKAFKKSVLWSTGISVVASDYSWHFPCVWAWLCIKFALIIQSISFLNLWFFVWTFLHLHQSLNFPGNLYWILLFSSILSFKKVQLKEVIRFRDQVLTVLFLQLGNSRWLTSARWCMVWIMQLWKLWCDVFCTKMDTLCIL